MTRRVVMAPDKFKGSLTGMEVAARLAAGLERTGFLGETVGVSVADGGDGTVDAAVAAGYERIEARVSGPLGETVRASFAFRDQTAVIEAAAACGLALLPHGRRAPLTATTRGVGELILAALGMGATRLVLGVGGSATTDGGAGMLQALGARLTDASGQALPPGGAALAQLATVDLSRLHDLSRVEFVLASDVDNPLLGLEGAAAVYAPQKGASTDEVAVLDAALAHWAQCVELALGRRYRNASGAGAAGGLGFAAIAFFGARTQPGVSLLLDVLSFSQRLNGARLVITGEGSLDEQTLHGKTPVGVARAVAAHGQNIPVVAVAGRCTLTPDELRTAGIAAAYPLTAIESDLARCMAYAGPLVEQVGERIAADWLR